MTHSSEQLASIDWPQWARLYSVVASAGRAFFNSARGAPEEKAIEAITKLVMVHYDVMTSFNQAHGSMGKNNLALLHKRPNTVEALLIGKLIAAFAQTQKALSPVRPLIAREIESTFESDEAARAILASVEAQKAKRSTRGGCHQARSVGL